MSRCTVRGVALDEKTTAPFVILHNREAETIIPLQVGPSEAGAIILELEQVRPELPGTWDFLEGMFRHHGFTVKQLEIYRKEGERYRSRIVYRKGIRTYRKEIQPADGIVLSIKFGSPIYMDPAIVLSGERETEFYAHGYGEQTEMLYLEPGQPVSSLM